MIKALNEVIKCLSLPYFIAGTMALIVIFRRNKIAFLFCFLIVFFSLFVRSIFFTLSSRYFAFFIVFSFLLNSSVIKDGVIKQSWERTIFFIALLISLIFNFIHVFTSNRNNYLFALIEDASRNSLKNDHTLVLIDQKEYNRIGSKVKDISKKEVLHYFPENANKIGNNLFFYDFWDNDAFIYVSDNRSICESEVIRFINTHNLNIQKVGSYPKSESNAFAVFHLDKFSPSVYSCKELLSDSFLGEVLKNGIMKSCNPFYDSYIIQYDKKLFWFIGISIDERTNIIYLLHTDRLDLLPPKMHARKYDDRSFPVGSSYELGLFGPYRVFCKEIPVEYPVTKVRVGLNTQGNVVTFNSFSVPIF